MRSLIIAAGVALLSSAASLPAMAQAADALPVSGAGGQQPGGLAPHDVIGKRLNDADGNLLGQITGVSKDGRTAMIKPASGSSTTSVDMAQLSLGTGARQVILGDSHPPQAPNWSRSSSSVTSTTTAVPPPTVTSTTTTTMSGQTIAPPPQ